MFITASIVTYRNSFEVLSQAIASFLNTDLNVKLFIVDNSPDQRIKEICLDERIEYVYNNKNVGFGAGHNIAINRIINDSDFHVVINPDVYFEKGVLESIAEYMSINPEVGQVMPKVLYPDGSIQYLCKLLPTPVDLFIRRFIKMPSLLNDRNVDYELRFTNYDKRMNVPYLSGCFMFLRTSVLKEVGLFDEKIFMYMEDTDLTRRIHQKHYTMFLPDTHIYHHFAKGSHKSYKLMMYAIHGAIIYFNKWGWFFDKERRKINSNLLKTLRALN